jgi:hypothetical protein
MVRPEGPGALTSLASCIACLNSFRSEFQNTFCELIFTPEAIMQHGHAAEI